MLKGLGTIYINANNLLPNAAKLGCRDRRIEGWTDKHMDEANSVKSSWKLECRR